MYGISGRIVIICSLLFVVNSTLLLAADPSYCNRYADSAIKQYREALALDIPGLFPPVWQSNRANHYNWCLTVTTQQVDSGFRLRQDILDKYQKSTSGKDLQVKVAPVQMGKLKPIIPNNILESQKEIRCKQYTKAAIAQENENQNRKCGYSGSAWSANGEHHYQWCMHGNNIELLQDALDSRSSDLAKCAPKVGGAAFAPLPDIDPKVPDIVERWAPVIYQDVDGSFWQADMITSVNYDGNWKGSDNTSNLHSKQYARVPAFVYYSLVSTASHHLIGYYFYHAEDTTPWYNGGHEHDFEGILVAVNRKTRQPEALLSNVHGHYVAYTRSGLNDPAIIKKSDKYGDDKTTLEFVPSSKGKGLMDLGVGIEANTHATWGRWNTRCVLGGSGQGGGGCDSSHGGDGIRYYYGGRADIPVHSGQYPDWPEYSYKLEDIQILWQRSFDPKSCGQDQSTATFACQLVDGWSVPWDKMNSKGKDTGDLPWVWGVDRIIGHTCQGPSVLLDPAAVLLYWFHWQAFNPTYTSNPYAAQLKCN